MKIPCPSGLVFEARKWKIGDIAELIGERERFASSLPLKMAELACISTIEQGPYKFTDKVDFSQVSLPDIAVANILLRVGSNPLLRLQPACEGCRRPLRDAIEIDLSEMPVFMASKEGAEHLRTNAPVQRQYGVHKVALKAVRGSDFKTLAKLQDEEPTYILEYQHVLHIAQVSGGELKAPLVNVPDIRAWYHEQDISLRAEIDDDIDELWGGVDQSFTFRCDHLGCGLEQSPEVPLDLAFYGLDQGKKQHRRSRRSSAKRSAGELMGTLSATSSSSTPKSPASTSEESKKSTS